MTRGTVFDIKRFSLHDGPGIRTTVFLKGCGLRCWWCHNPESQRPGPELLLRPELCIGCGACAEACPEGAISSETLNTDRARCTTCGTCLEACYAEGRAIVGRMMSVDEVMAEVLRDVAFYDESGGGVTLSGGEPLLQADFAADLLRACKAHGLHTAVDTCGHVPATTFDRIRGDVDLFLYDLKLMDDTRHRQFTGATNRLILENLRQLATNGQRIVVRVPVIPGITDDSANLDAIAAFIQTLPGIERIDILAYHRIGGDKYARLGRENPLPPTKPPTEATMLAIQHRLESTGRPVNLGG